MNDVVRRSSTLSGLTLSAVVARAGQWPRALVTALMAWQLTCCHDIGYQAESDAAITLLSGTSGDGQAKPDAGNDAKREAALDGFEGRDEIQEAGLAVDDGESGAGDATVDDALSESVDGSAGSSNATKPIVAKSTQCFECARENCMSEIISCGAIEGNATAGPAAGTSRSELCIDELACVLQSDCAVQDWWLCYCGAETLGAGVCWVEGQPKGDCKDAIERATELGGPPVDVLSQLTNQAKAAGWAYAVVQCLWQSRCVGCFGPNGDASVDGPNTTDSGAD